MKSVIIIFGIISSSREVWSYDTTYRNCTDKEWRCKNGICIPLTRKCDGEIDCTDQSDESFVTCWNYDGQFRCAYGGCVNAGGTCNGLKDCPDNSDEMLLRCRNEMDFIHCMDQRMKQSDIILNQAKSKGVDDFFNLLKKSLPTTLALDCLNLDATCKNGEIPKEMTKCNGKVECTDGSDETLETCATMRDTCHGHVFICAYGACIPYSARCNGVRDCVDNSDELNDICQPTPTEFCILPDLPLNGYYTAYEAAESSSPQDMIFHLNYSCHPGFKLMGASNPYCLRGLWSEPLPTCVRESQCKLPKHPSVQYICIGDNEYECEDFVPNGTIVRPKCRTPEFYASTILTYMTCDDGIWNYIATCSPQCGLVYSFGEDNELELDGRRARRGEMPWQAAIYTTTTKPYMEICGGSLVSANIIISAAHCFTEEFNVPVIVEDFAVAVGKQYRPWNDDHELDAQKSNISEIITPPRFKHSLSNIQEDIVIVKTIATFKFHTFIRPVCLDFEYNFEHRQLKVGNYGKFAGYGLITKNEKEYPVLQVIDMPYQNIQKCLEDSSKSFREFITTDKFCAGNGTRICKTDSGGGLVFIENEQGTSRYFLRGVMTALPNSKSKCQDSNYAVFTWVSKHEEFIKAYL